MSWQVAQLDVLTPVLSVPRGAHLAVPSSLWRGGVVPRAPSIRKAQSLRQMGFHQPVLQHSQTLHGK